MQKPEKPKYHCINPENKLYDLLWICIQIISQQIKILLGI